MKHFFKQNNWEDKEVESVSFNTKTLKRKLEKTQPENGKDTKEEIPTEEPKIKRQKKKTNQQQGEQVPKNNVNKSTTKNSTEQIKPQQTTTSEFSNKLRETLKGGRFRFINQQLYTMKGSDAKKLFDEDLEAFGSYHEGYRHQVEKWPFNPLNRIIKKVKKLPKHMIIADFGCGEAKLAESINNKVFSIDLVSSKPEVLACDMANTTLSTNSIDVTVYCLSLMGININEFLLEANRVLKAGGLMYIAEIASRFDNLKEFIRFVERFGFQMQRKDQDDKKFFIFFDFKKINNINDKNQFRNIQLQLKPCIYKKR